MKKNLSLQNEKLEILKLELSLMQSQVDKHDSMSAKIKTWATTLWVALIGWSFQSMQPKIIILAILLLLIFWIFDGAYKNFRTNYRMRRNEVANILAAFYKTGEFPEGSRSPKMPKHSELSGALKGSLEAHVALPYIVLIIVSIIILLRF